MCTLGWRVGLRSWWTRVRKFSSCHIRLRQCLRNLNIHNVKTLYIIYNASILRDVIVHRLLILYVHFLPNLLKKLDFRLNTKFHSFFFAFRVFIISQFCPTVFLGARLACAYSTHGQVAALCVLLVADVMLL